MTRTHTTRSPKPAGPRLSGQAVLVWSLVGLAAGTMAAVILLARQGPPLPPDAVSHVPLAAVSRPAAPALSEPTPAAFAEFLTASIHRDGALTATIHVGLADAGRERISARFGNGNDPSENYYWGALYGLENYLVNAAGWRRAYRDGGDGVRILRRTVFHRRIAPNTIWRQRGVSDPFDIYVLALAWRADEVVAAIQEPLRDALAGEQLVLHIDGQARAFGSGSGVTGYFGPNPLTERYADPLEGIVDAASRGPVGVFYICAMSGVYFHPAVREKGLYPLLFTRRPLVTEAYIVAGLLEGLASGHVDDGLIDAAAAAYAARQKTVTMGQARSLFYR